MSVTVQLDVPPVIMIDGKHLELPFDMASLCVTGDDDRLTAFLNFTLDEEGCKSSINLAGCGLSGKWIEAGRVACRLPRIIKRDEFETLLGEFTLQGASALRLAFDDTGAVQVLRKTIVDEFHTSIGKHDLKVKCDWERDGMFVTLNVAKYGLSKLTLGFLMPYEAACRVVQDRRRKSA